MKRFERLKTLLSVLALLLLIAPKAKAEGEYAWPANYGGVMLQGFYWDSYKDSKWTTLQAQAAELSSYFDLIWVPNSGKSSSNPSMGYNPAYWFSPNHNSSFGTETELRSMINTYRQFGVGLIEDVVVNHRNGATNWYDFPTETYKGVTYTLGLDAICKNDEMANEPGQPKPTGAYDTGDNFDGCRDLDHTNQAVRDAIKAYLDALKNDFGYAGFRYDMVKGFGSQYVKEYNESAKCTYSVGEYWDGYDKITNWIEGTGRQSAAFDFPFKFALNDAFSKMDFSQLSWKRNGSLDQVAGLVHMDTYQRYAVTFVDNHDTYRETTKFTGDVEAANAFMLCSPGTPCVLLAHWIEKKDAIKNLIAIRKSVGLTNQSAVKVLTVSKNMFVAEVTGANGSLVIKVGRGSYTPNGYSAADKVAGNNAYSIWTKVPVQNLEKGIAKLQFSPEGGLYPGGTTVTMTIANADQFTDPKIVYTTDGSDPSLTNGTQVATGAQIQITKSLKLKAIAIAGGKLVSDMKTATYMTKEEPIEVFVEKPASWKGINIYAWVETELMPWPGTPLTETVEKEGTTWYHYNFGTAQKSVNIIFNNGTDQTVDIEGVEFGQHFYRLNKDTGKDITVTKVDMSGSVSSLAQGHNVFVYPNPATETIFVKTDGEIAAIRVFSVSGQQVAESTGTDNVNVASLQNGLYLYRVTFTDGSATQGKFIKK